MKKFWVLIPFVVALSLLMLLTLLSRPRIGGRNTRQMQCLNNMRNVGMAIYSYTTEHEGDIPATETGEPPHSWRVDILPYLEQQTLHDEYQIDQLWNEGTNREIAETLIEVYECLSAPSSTTSEGFGLTGYAAITGTNAMWGKKKSLNLSEVSGGDGLSQTLQIVEACGQNIAWSEPRDVDLDSMTVGINLPSQKSGKSDSLLSGYHEGGANVIFADGSAQFLSESIDPEVLKKLCTATGGEKVSASDY